MFDKADSAPLIAAGTRDVYVDNLRSALIFLVIYGHIIEIFIPSSNIYYAIFVTIYAFHMPLFAVITGYLSKNVDKARDRAFADLFIPYIFCEIAFSLGTGKLFVNLFSAQFTSWYLLSAFFWRISLKDAVKIRFAVAAFIILGLYVGLVNEIGDFLSLSRTITFFPFFLIGHFFGGKLRADIERIPLIAAVVGFCVLACTVAFIFIKGYVDYAILFNHLSYKALGLSPIAGIVWRSLFYIIATLMSICFFKIIPKKQGFLTSVGANTITIFLFHSVFLIPIKRYSQWFSAIPPLAGIFLFFAIALVIFFSLGNRFVMRIYRWAIDLGKKVMLR